jgi:hypothetical protein
MKNITLTFIGFILINISFAQEDWKLPMVNGKIQFEFNSKKLNTAGRDLCESYHSINFYSELSKELQAVMTNGKIKFWSASSYTIFPTLYAADMSYVNPEKMILKCKPAEPDTIIGSLKMTITQIKVFAGYRGGNIDCLYRIIIDKDSYNIKFRAFKYHYYQTGSMFKAGQMVTVDLEDEYTELNTSRSDKQYWADIKMLVKLYHNTLEEILGKQASDFNFDD